MGLLADTEAPDLQASQQGAAKSLVLFKKMSREAALREVEALGEASDWFLHKDTLEVNVVAVAKAKQMAKRRASHWQFAEESSEVSTKLPTSLASGISPGGVDSSPCGSFLRGRLQLPLALHANRLRAGFSGRLSFHKCNNKTNTDTQTHTHTNTSLCVHCIGEMSGVQR